MLIPQLLNPRAYTRSYGPYLAPWLPRPGCPTSGGPNRGSTVNGALAEAANTPTSAACCVKFRSSKRQHQRPTCHVAAWRNRIAGEHLHGMSDINTGEIKLERRPQFTLRAANLLPSIHCRAIEWLLSSTTRTAPVPAADCAPSLSRIRQTLSWSLSSASPDQGNANPL